MTHDYKPFKLPGRNYYDDPWKELTYKVLERTIKDAKGKEMLLDHKEIGERNKRINDARAFIKSPAFELMCDGLNIDPLLIIEKVNGKRNNK